MSDLIRAELLKLRTTRMSWWIAAAALAFVPLGIALAIQAAGQAGNATLDSSEGLRNVILAASSGGVLVLVLGIFVVAGEFRHDTATATFLINPDRGRVVGAKLVAAGLAGVAVGVGVGASLVTLAVAVPWLSAKGVDLGAHSGDIALVLLAALAATVLSAVVGVGFGALLPNQVAGVTVALVWTLLVDGLVVEFVPEIGRWFPGAAARALSADTSQGNLLPIWVGTLVFAGYGLAFAAAGTRLVLRRDIS